jgi:hypothetical protein
MVEPDESRLHPIHTIKVNADSQFILPILVVVATGSYGASNTWRARAFKA